MNLFGVGPAEVVVILVIALIFVGPERLPRLAADIARTIREIRKYTGSIAAELTEVLQDFEKETAGERSQWKEIGEGLTDATRSVTDALRGARADAETATAPAPAAAASTPGASPNGTPAAEPEVWRDIAEPAPTGAAPAAPPQPAEEPR